MRAVSSQGVLRLCSVRCEGQVPGKSKCFPGLFTERDLTQQKDVQLCILCIKPLRHTSDGLRGNQPDLSEFQSLAGVIRVQDPNLTSNMHL